MRATQTKELRSITGLPRRPKDMTKEERTWYRDLKRRFKSLPHNAKQAFLENVSDMQRRMRESGVKGRGAV